MSSALLDRSSGARLVAIVCTAQVFVQIGAFYWPALLPQMMQHWSLTNSEAGWITSSFYAAYMLSVPVLVTLTDRIDAKRVYLFGVGCTLVAHLAFGLLADGFWSAMALRGLAGIGWAGTYMTGLKLLADQVDAKMMSRAVTRACRQHRHLGRGLLLLGDFLADEFGWRWAFASAGLTAAIAWITVALAVPSRRAAARESRRPAGAVRLPPGAAQPLGLRLLARLLRAHAGDERAARLGRGLPRLGGGP